MPKSDSPILEEEIARTRKSFKHPLLTRKPATMTHIVQTIIPPNQSPKATEPW